MKKTATKPAMKNCDKVCSDGMPKYAKYINQHVVRLKYTVHNGAGETFNAGSLMVVIKRHTEEDGSYSYILRKPYAQLMVTGDMITLVGTKADVGLCNSQ